MNAPLPTYDGLDASELARRCNVPRVVLLRSVGSTMDVAHDEAAAGAPGGTLILTDRQNAGRGRGGRVWSSESGSSITCTLVERPADAASLSVLSLRIGLALAEALQRFSGEPLLVKWPNDLMRGERKLGGVLSEARWRDGRPEWVAIGTGINVQLPVAVPGAAALDAGVSRADVLQEMLPAIRAAGRATGELTVADLGRFRDRDWSWGRLVREPHRGVARGITSRGELMVETEYGRLMCTAGSLVLAEEGHAAGP